MPFMLIQSLSLWVSHSWTEAVLGLLHSQNPSGISAAQGGKVTKFLS